MATPATATPRDPTVELIDELLAMYRREAAHHRREAERLEAIAEGLEGDRTELTGAAP